MKVICIGKHPVPHGFGLTVFFNNLTSGLKKAGCDVKLFIVWPTEYAKRVLNAIPSGSFQGTDYRYTCNTTTYPDCGRWLPLVKVWYFISGIFRLWSALREESRKQKIDIIIATGSLRSYWLILKIYSMMYHCGLICYHGEYLACGQKVSWPHLPSFWLEKYLYPRMADGFLVITGYLERFFQRYARKGSLFCRIPILLNTEAFPEPQKTEDAAKTIAYCGDMSGDKDGVGDLIDIFSVIHRENPELKLQLIGSASSVVMKRLQERCAAAGLSDPVIFSGRLPHDEVLAALANATVLILTRPNNKQAEGGFPSKLGEYLYTGNPVLVSAIGEIPEILTDKLNIYLAQPDNREDFTHKLRMILANLPEAEKVGRAGKQFAAEHFDYRIQCKKIVAFCEQIVRQKDMGDV